MFGWFKNKIRDIVREEIDNTFKKHGEVNVDVHLKTSSWAVIKLDEGNDCCYLKFVDLPKQDLKQIKAFLSQFEYNKGIDANPLIVKNMLLNDY